VADNKAIVRGYLERARERQDYAVVDDSRHDLNGHTLRLGAPLEHAHG
jgi:hypothetical protein